MDWPPAPGARLIEDNVRERHFDVDSNFDEWRLDKFLSHRLSRLSRDKANAIAKHGDVTLRPPRRTKPATRLRAGEVVVLREHLPPEWVQDAEVSTLLEDDDLLILNKPAGMLVHESASVRLNTIQHYLMRKGIDGAEPVHRLDRETSGVLVCARRHDLVPTLRDLFATDHPDKVYRAIVHDPERRWVDSGRVTITHPIGPQTHRELSLRMGPGDLHATTHVTPIGGWEDPEWGWLSDVQVAIETGRQHQIRVHLEMEGTPIAGDKLYGHPDHFFMAVCDAPDDPDLTAQLAYPRHALHAWRITLPHPTTHAPLTVEAPLPQQLWPHTT